MKSNVNKTYALENKSNYQFPKKLVFLSILTYSADRYNPSVLVTTKFLTLPSYIPFGGT